MNTDNDLRSGAGSDTGALLAYAQSLHNHALGIDAVTTAIVTVIEAERRYARMSYTILLGISIANAFLWAFSAAWSMHAPLPGAILVGVLAGMGAGTSGLILVPWISIARRLRTLVQRWRRR
ncbi:MAG TPA: hypothetical protein VF509_14190 [Sphingobium sp.]